MTRAIFITVLCLFILFFNEGSAIKCWECNSKHDPRCGDPFSNFSIALVDCDQKSADITHLLDEHEKLKYTVDEGGEPKATICRKTYQFVEEELRIVRGCGWVPNNSEYTTGKTCFNRAGTHHVQIFHCVCHEDGCNTATSNFQLSQFLAILVPILPAYFMIQ